VYPLSDDGTPGPKLAQACAILHVSKISNPSEFVQRLKGLMKACQTAGVDKVLIDPRSRLGPQFTLAEQVYVAREILAFWESNFRLAFVFPSAKDTIPESVAVFQLVPIRTFKDETKAVAWLWQKRECSRRKPTCSAF
jgi:hypothetical protein